jgi:FMN phosphatase YigB (HAD superfamily)
MVKILMLDLGETLVHGTESLFPHVPEALEAFGQFRAADGDPLATCLVSDFGPADPRPTPEQVETAFREYVSLLERLHLKHFFEPVSRHVTLSVQVRVRKPDLRIFEAAIRRLGFSAELSDCLFITEDAGHVAACRNLGSM